MAADPIELLNHRKGGSEFWVELHITPVADDIGWYRYWVSVQRETDERRHFDGQRRLYTLILANVSDGILVADALRPNFPIEFANAGFTRMTGYTQADLLDLNGRLLQGPETDPVARQQLRRGIERQVSVTTEIFNYPKAGSTFWNLATITPLRDASPGQRDQVCRRPTRSQRRQVARARDGGSAAAQGRRRDDRRHRARPQQPADGHQRRCEVAGAAPGRRCRQPAIGRSHSRRGAAWNEPGAAFARVHAHALVGARPDGLATRLAATRAHAATIPARQHLAVTRPAPRRTLDRTPNRCNSNQPC